MSSYEIHPIRMVKYVEDVVYPDREEILWRGDEYDEAVKKARTLASGYEHGVCILKIEDGRVVEIDWGARIGRLRDCPPLRHKIRVQEIQLKELTASGLRSVVAEHIVTDRFVAYKITDDRHGHPVEALVDTDASIVGFAWSFSKCVEWGRSKDRCVDWGIINDRCNLATDEGRQSYIAALNAAINDWFFDRPAWHEREARARE
jgi:hypothetical protein